MLYTSNFENKTKLTMDTSDIRTLNGLNAIAKAYRTSGYIFGEDIADALQSPLIPINQRTALLIMCLYFSETQLRAAFTEGVVDQVVELLGNEEPFPENYRDSLISGIRQHNDSRENRDLMISQSFVVADK